MYTGVHQVKLNQACPIVIKKCASLHTVHDAGCFNSTALKCYDLSKELLFQYYLNILNIEKTFESKWAKFQAISWVQVYMHIYIT